MVAGVLGDGILEGLEDEMNLNRGGVDSFIRGRDTLDARY